MLQIDRALPSKFFLGLVLIAFYFVCLPEIHGQRAQRSIAERAVAEGERLCSEGDATFHQQALKKFEKAAAVWGRLGESEREATALRSMGQIYARLGESLKAVDYFSRSMTLCERAGSVACEIATRNELSAAYLVVGEKDKAREHCETALKLSRSSNDRAGEAHALNNTGEIFYYRGDREKALEHYKQALSIWTSLANPKGEAQTLLYLGYSYVDLSDSANATDHYNRALQLWRTTNDIRGEGLTLTALGHLHNNRGERQKALDYYDQAAPLLRRAGDRLGEARALNGKGFIYSALGEPKRALIYYQQARQLFRDIAYKSGEVSSLLLMARVSSSLGDAQTALVSYQELLELVRGSADERMESHVLGDVAMVYASTGDTRKALDYCRQAHTLSRKLKDRIREISTLTNIAYLTEREGDKRAALTTFNEAYELSKLIGDRPRQSLTLYHRARVSRALGNLDEARLHIEEALKLSNTLRANVSGEMRALYFASVHQFYELHVDVLMDLYASRKDQRLLVQAFETSERARARSLMESLAEARANVREGVSADLLAREEAVQRQIKELSQQRIALTSEEGSAAKIAEIEKQLDSLAIEFQQVQGHIRASNPRYAALVQPSPLMLAEIQRQVLDPDMLLLEYFLGTERSFAWAVTKDSIKYFELPSRAEIERASRRVYELLTARNVQVAGETLQQRRARVRLADDEFATASAALSKMIVGPVANELENKLLVVVADGALQYVPFGALHGNSNEPLISKHEIVLAPSVSTLAVMRDELRGRKPASKTIAVLADAVFDKSDDRLLNNLVARKQKSNASSQHSELVSKALRSFDGLGSSISRLPYSRREAQAIMALVPESDAMMALGFRASRTTALSAELSQYRYIHFATHGLLNSEHPELSGILLSTFDESGRRQNGFLQLHEVYNLKLSADLVVLSACQTALGKEIRGEGIVGLTRGFMYAGVPRVVASLWQVDDAATADLMREFYSAMLTQGKRPAEALRLAQVHMSQQSQWSSPYYWAAFTLQGEWR